MERQPIRVAGIFHKFLEVAKCALEAAEAQQLLLASRKTIVAIGDIFIGYQAKSKPSRSLIRQRVEGIDPISMSKSAAIYVHFDREGTVHDYVIHQLTELLNAGFRITFVSNSPILPKASWDRLLPLCKTVIWRENAGYDFGAYKDGLASLENLQALDGLVLMNDSVYGPFWSLKHTLDRIDRSTIDFWSITDSWEHAYHVQTFFLLFFPSALRADAFDQFWRSLPYVNDKWWVVRNAEIKLTQLLAQDGLRVGVLAPYWSVAEKAKDRLRQKADPVSSAPDTEYRRKIRDKLLTGYPLNPMYHFWDILIEDFKCPFIKRELLKSNPASVPTVGEWRNVLRARSNYNVAFVAEHLKS